MNDGNVNGTGNENNNQPPFRDPKWIAAGVGIVLILVLGFIWMRPSHKGAAGSPDAVGSAASAGGENAQGVAGASGVQSVNGKNIDAVKRSGGQAAGSASAQTDGKSPASVGGGQDSAGHGGGSLTASAESNGVAGAAGLTAAGAAGGVAANGLKPGMPGSQTVATAVGGSNGTPGATPNQPEVKAAPKFVGPGCVKAAFHHDDKELKVKRHELTLKDKVKSKKDLCVTVDGEGVDFTLENGTKVVLDRRIRNKDTEIIATYCFSGECKISCPKPKKDFFDEVSGESSDEVIKGFAGEQSAEEKQLQRDLSSLQKLLKEPNEKKTIAEWSEARRVDGPCSDVVANTKF